MVEISEFLIASEKALFLSLRLRKMWLKLGDPSMLYLGYIEKGGSVGNHRQSRTGVWGSGF